MTRSLESQALRIVASCHAYRARRLSRVITRLYNDLLRPVGMNVAEMNLLAAIAAHGSIQPARLGRALELEKSTMSRNITRLVERGWLVIRDNPDERGELVALTTSGRAALEKAVGTWEEAQRRAGSILDGSAIPEVVT